MSQTPVAPALEAHELHKVYRIGRHTIPVLRGATFTIAAGEWVALVGPSGSGKTTVLHLLGGLDKPTSGHVRFLGVDYARLRPGARAHLRRDRIGFVFQSYHLFPELNAVENVVLPALQWGWNRRTARDRARALLAQFGLSERERHRPQELSGGEQQRVALARALVNDPDVILADEPTGNLDDAASRAIIDILTRLNRDQGKTIVMVTHDRALAGHAVRTLALENGRPVPLTATKADNPVQTADTEDPGNP